MNKLNSGNLRLIKPINEKNNIHIDKVVTNSNDIRNWTIYKITSPSGRIYIGKTINFKRRVSDYKSLSRCKGQRLIHRSLIKYGFDSHKIELLDSFNGSFVDGGNKEIFWIRSYMSHSVKWKKEYGVSGLNLTIGGEGLMGFKMSEESKRKMSLKKVGKPPPNKGKKGQIPWCTGTKGMVIAWNKGKKFEGDEDERKIKFGSHNVGNSYNKGRKQSAEIVAARVARQKGKPLEKKYKPIAQIDKDGNTINLYPSLKDTIISAQLYKSALDRALKSGKPYKGYLYKYA